jgi:hypothetical protein
MTDAERPAYQDLQFDRVVAESAHSAPTDTLAVTCSRCKASIETSYYDVNGHVLCSDCRSAVISATETPRGIAPLITAGAFGLGAGVVGAAIYYAVIAIAHLEIGIVAILIGYMVGYAVRKGSGERGGRRFQVLAVALTYVSIALAYTPLAVRGLGYLDLSVLPLVRLSAFVAALPVLMAWSSFPSGLISAFIILIGMRQAWKMTGAPSWQILGPYRVGASATPTPA